MSAVVGVLPTPPLDEPSSRSGSPCLRSRSPPARSRSTSPTLAAKQPEENSGSLLPNMTPSADQEVKKLLGFADIVYRCSLCDEEDDMVFSTPEHFAVHIEEIHLTKSNENRCQRCQLNFASEEDFENHRHIAESHASTNAKSDVDAKDNVQQESHMNGNVHRVKSEPPAVRSPGSPGVHEELSIRTDLQGRPQGVPWNPPQKPLAPFRPTRNPSPLLLQMAPQSQPSSHSSPIAQQRPSPHAVRGAPGDGRSNWPAYHWRTGSGTPYRPDLEKKFGRYASEIVICGNSFLYCQICCLKFDSELECGTHFKGVQHLTKVHHIDNTHKAHMQRFIDDSKSTYHTLLNKVSSSIQECTQKPNSPNDSHRDKSALDSMLSQTTQCPTGVQKSASSPVATVSDNYANTRVDSVPSEKTQDGSSSRSRRKRSLPCKTQLKSSEDSDSEVDLDEAMRWSSTQPPRMSLMQSDRKRLALSPRDPSGQSDDMEVDSPTPTPPDVSVPGNVDTMKYSSSENREMSDGDDSDANRENTSSPAGHLSLSTANICRAADRLETGETESKHQGAPGTNYTAWVNSPANVQEHLKASQPVYHYPPGSEEAVNSCPAEAPVSATSGSFKQGPHMCHQCHALFTDVSDFCSHYTEKHLPSSTGQQAGSTGDQQFKVIWLKQLLPKFLSVRESGCVSRDELLERMSGEVDTTDAALWGPSCNKAIREVFPDSQALRKGKFKRTFYFGVQYTEQSSSPHDSRDDEDVVEEVDDKLLSPTALRNMAQDIDKIVTHLPDVVQWTGHMANCVTRDVLLNVLSSCIPDSDVLSWGVQCNRAVRQLYPEVFMKRRGKFKTTCYYGLEIACDTKRHPTSMPQASTPTWPKSSTGPPVVNALDIAERPGHSRLSRLPHTPPVVNALDIMEKPGHSHLSMLPQRTATPGGGARASPSTMPRLPERTSTPPQRRSSPHTPPTMESYQKPMSQTSEPEDLSSKTVNDKCERNGANVNSETSGNTSPETNNNQKDSENLAEVNQSPVVTDSNTEIRNMLNFPPPMNSLGFFYQPPGVPFFGMPPGGLMPVAPSHVDNLEKLILLHPGPFVTARIFAKRFQKIVPTVEKVVYAMTMLQSRGLGQMFTMKQGNSKVFFKAVPSRSLEMPLSMLGVRFVDYQVMFGERDSKLDDSLHNRLKSFYPQPELLSSFYAY